MPMTRRFFLALLLICVPFLPRALADENKPLNPADFKQPIRIACVGDSITFGAGVEQREKNCYPVVLGNLLGDKWETRNFGVSGATLLKKGDLPYWKQKAFTDAKAYKPDVVIIKLGTNDTKPQNWKFKEEFATDMAAMIDEFSKLESKPRIYLCLPVPAYPERWGIRDSVIKDELLPILKKLAQEKKLTSIDLYTALSDKPEMFPDKIHPNAAGAKLMAQTIHKTLIGK